MEDIFNRHRSQTLTTLNMTFHFLLASAFFGKSALSLIVLLKELFSRYFSFQSLTMVCLINFAFFLCILWNVSYVLTDFLSFLELLGNVIYQFVKFLAIPLEFFLLSYSFSLFPSGTPVRHIYYKFSHCTIHILFALFSNNFALSTSL